MNHVTNPELRKTAAQRSGSVAKKSRMALWLVLALVSILLAGCGSSGPADTIDKLNAAALDGDSAEFDKYFDREAVATAAYDAFVEEWVNSPEAEEALAQTGETDAQALLDMFFPREEFISELASGFDVSNIEGMELFPEYNISSTSITNDEAEVALTFTDEGEELEAVLGMEKRDVDGGKAWVIVEIKNILDIMGL